MLPNILDDLELTASAHRLYCHLKRVAGERGKTSEGVDAMAAKCRMNRKTVMRAKAQLEEKGLIEVRIPRDRSKPDELVLTDIWERNSEHFGAVPNEERSPECAWTAVPNEERGVVPNEERKNISTKDKKDIPPPGAAPEPKSSETEPPKPDTPDSGKPTAADYVAVLVERLADKTVALSEAWKGRFARDVKRELKRETSPEVLDDALDRIVERWDDYQLSLTQAMDDVLKKQRSGTSRRHRGSGRESPPGDGPENPYDLKSYFAWKEGRRAG